MPEGPGRDRSRLGAVQAITRRLDLVTAIARLLLENEGFSESRTLQRCARLIVGELTAWVIVDLERRHRMRRQFVLGPDDPGLADLSSALSAVDPQPGSIPYSVHESGRPALIAHVDDPGVLGAGLDGEPLLTKVDATSVLSVPLTDGENRYGVLTLLRRAADGHFKVADLALVEELGRQMGLAIRVSRTFRRRSDTADALTASMLPRRWPDIPAVDLAVTYLAAAEDPEVGGDFYDVYQTPDGWGLAIGDVCGKGEEAPAVTAAARHAIRVLARRCADPAEVLAGTNEIVLADELSLDGGFVTANVAHLSWQDGKLHVVLGSAGHPAAIVLRADGGVRVMNGGGLPLGLFADAQPATQELVMDTGDVLFLYTDGVAQARGPANTYFQDRLADELTGLAGEAPGDIVASMRRAMLDFTGGNLVDDVTMLVMRAERLVKGSPSAAGAGARRKMACPVRRRVLQFAFGARLSFPARTRHHVRVIDVPGAEPAAGAWADAATVTFRVPDPGHRLAGVRLSQQVCPRDRLHFRRARPGLGATATGAPRPSPIRVTRGRSWGPSESRASWSSPATRRRTGSRPRPKPGRCAAFDVPGGFARRRDLGPTLGPGRRA